MMPRQFDTQISVALSDPWSLACWALLSSCSQLMGSISPRRRRQSDRRRLREPAPMQNSLRGADTS